MKVPKLIVLDLDGTLLPESKRLTERSRAALLAMERLGSTIALATGKFLHLAARYARELDLRTKVIALDGARVAAHDGEPRSRCIPLRTAQTLLARYDRPSWDGFADNGADQLLVRVRRRELLRTVSVWAEQLHEVGLMAEHLIGPPALLAFYGPRRELRAMADEVTAEHAELRTSLVDSISARSARLTLQPRGVSKGSGLRELLAELGLAPADCMVFGDWHNDLPMFELGCTNVAMANAVPELKAAAHHVLEHSSEQDGVARFLEHTFCSVPSG